MVCVDPALHLGQTPVSVSYRHFAEREALGISEVYADWALRVSTDLAVLSLLETLPRQKRQPNLVFAASRWHGAETTYSSFRGTLLHHWQEVRTTIQRRATQTNEAGRCAVLLPYLAALPQPLALIEVGAAAGLCLLPDRYSYRYDDGPSLDPDDGASQVVLPCRLAPGVPVPAMPQIAWRAGIDLAPVDVNDPDACAWLETLVWPEQEERRTRLRAALALAQREHPTVVRGDLTVELPALAKRAPADATLVVFHTAVLAYVQPKARARFVEVVGHQPGHWISNEGQTVVDLTPLFISIRSHDSRFLLAVDGVPRALTDPHGRSIEAVPRPTTDPNIIAAT